MIENKFFNGGLNLDDSQFRLPPNDYIDALNITKDAVEGSNDQVITPIIANRIGDSSYTLPAGTNVCIGAYANTLRNTVIQMIWNSNDYHLILEYNLSTRVQTPIFSNLTDSGDVDVLGFTENEKITSINVYNRDEGDLLFFIDSLGRPTGLDIALFKQGEYTPVTRSILDKAKSPPLIQPSAVYDNDTTTRSNDTRNKFFRFKYRWHFDDFEISTPSPISNVPIPLDLLDDTYTNVVTNNNVIRLVANTGAKNVKSIELLVSFVNKTNIWSNFQSVTILEKSSLGLQHTIQQMVGTTNVEIDIVTFSSTPLEGTIVNVYLTELPNTETLVGTYTIVNGDTLSDVAAGLVTSMDTIGIVLSPFSNNETLVYAFSTLTYAFDRIDATSGGVVDNIDFPYSFYNDSTYPTIDVEESIQLYDYVPPFANAQDMPNGNILVYGGIREGYNKTTLANSVITINTIAAGNVGNIGTLSVVLVSKTVSHSLGYFAQTSIWQFSGVPAVGTVINVLVKQASDNTIITGGTYTTGVADTVESIVRALYAATYLTDIDALSFDPTGQITYRIRQSVYLDLTFELVPSLTSPSTNSIPTWPWSSSRQIARAYFDEKGRTNGILYTDKITFPEYAENGSHLPLIPYVNYKIYDTPPIWAYSFGFYFTKDPTEYKWWVTNGINKDETQYIYLEVTSFTINATKHPTTATVLSYSFKDGDRIRFIRDTLAAGVVFNDTFDCAIDGLVVDPTINSVPFTGGRQFIKIKNIAPFTAGIDATKNYVIDLYTPGQQGANADNQVYYELGRNYPVLNPGTDTRVHSGEVTNQEVGVTPAEFNFYDGDAYFRSRTISITELGFAIFNVIDKNIVDFYISEVSSVDGRPNVIDINAREAYYGTMVRFGQSYQPNTNINGLNRFYSKNFDEYDYSFGDAIRLKVRDRYMKVFQKLKIGVVPLYSSIGKDANGDTVVFQTDKLLNPIQYRVGNIGLGSAESLASFNFADYGCDTKRGIIWRDSNDGVQPISIIYKVNSWATENLPLREGDIKIYGAFDQRLNNYILALDAKLCTAVEVPDFTLNNVTIGTPYYQEVIVTGSLEFALSDITKPSWLSIVISGYKIIFSGDTTSVDSGSSIPVLFTITNDCGLVNVGKTINVSEPPCVPIAIVGDPVLPSGSIGTPYSYSIPLTGSQLYVITFTTKPGWMTITIVGSDLVFSGTPDAPATGVAVDVTVINGCGSVDFNGTIDITVENWFISNTNNDPTINLQVYIGNNNSSPSTLLYSGTYSSDPLSGTDLVNLPAVNLNCNLFVPGEVITSAFCNGIAGLGVGGSTIIWTGINGGPLTISFVIA